MPKFFRDHFVAVKADAAVNSLAWLESIGNLAELEVRYEGEGQILWKFMNPIGRACATPGLINDCLTVMQMIERVRAPISYLVTGSRRPGIFNLGGDLNLFRKMIQERNREGLRRYAHACVDIQYRRSIRMNLALCTIALVQGDALGGGFETALSHDVIIAEKSAKFGLPEILFNLFPGMGAYSFLARRLDPVRAERLITSGRLYSAEELYEMGVVDVVAEDGAGVDAVYGYIDTHRRARTSRLAIARLRGMVSPVTRQELEEITDLWVDTALALEARDLRKMELLVAAQNRRSLRPADAKETARAIA